MRRDDGRTAREYRTYRRALARVRRCSRPDFAAGVTDAGTVRGVLWCVRSVPQFPAELADELEHLSPGALAILDRGEGNGYARIPAGHPWRGDGDRLPVIVHGGITYADAAGWVGFDTAHIFDRRRYWPLWRVAGEARRLAAQVAKAAH